MIRRPPRSTRTDTLFPYTTLFRSAIWKIGLSCSSRCRSTGSTPWRYAPMFGKLARSKARALVAGTLRDADRRDHRSEEHTSELQSLMRISYAVFCLKKKKKHKKNYRR